MKKEAIRHPKLYDLAARLDCSRAEALGYLTLLFDFTEDSAPRGDIGKWADGAIARACEWMGEPSMFVESLIASGWLDRCACHRLRIHDWPDHCQTWVRAKIAKMGGAFLECYTSPLCGSKGAECVAVATIEPTIEATTEPTIVATGEATIEPSSRAPVPNRTKPNLTKPRESAPASPVSPSDGSRRGRSCFNPAAVPIPERLDTAEFVEAWSRWIRHRREIRKPLTETNTATLLGELARWGPDRAIAAINHTIAKGWQGLREPDIPARTAAPAIPGYVFPKLDMDDERT
jgi:hypothetical protein